MHYICQVIHHHQNEVLKRIGRMKIHDVEIKDHGNVGIGIARF